MLIRSAPDLRDCDVTDRSLYLQRRSIIAGAGAIGAGLALGADSASAAPLAVTRKVTTTTEKLTPKDDVTTYNNFYEFGTDKEDPAANAGRLKARPWTIAVAQQPEAAGRHRRRRHTGRRYELPPFQEQFLRRDV